MVPFGLRDRRSGGIINETACERSPGKRSPGIGTRAGRGIRAAPWETPQAMNSAALLAIAGVGLLAAMDVAIKYLGGQMPVAQLAFLRFAAGSVGALLLAAWLRPGWPGRETVTANAWRAMLVVVTATTFFYSLTALPLAEAIALSFIAPALIALLGVVILRERFSWRIGATLAIGFAGMLVIVGGRLGSAGFTAGWGVLAAVASAFTYALSLVLLRSRATRDPAVTIVAFQNVGPALILAAPAAWVWVPVSAEGWALAALIGAMGVVGHMLLAMAFARAPAATLAPIEYTALVWGSVWGFLFFAEVPGATTLAGAGMIVAGTLWGQWRPTRRHATP